MTCSRYEHFVPFSHFHPLIVLQDYHTLLSQLEHAFATSPSFTLQKFWFYVHPTLHTLSLLYSLVTEIAQADDPDGDSSSEFSSSSSDAARNEELGLGSGLKAVLSEMGMGGGGVAKGGEVVAIIWDRMANMSGDPTAHQLYRKLLRAASLPYAQMLQRWIRTGHLKDPCEELMVKESKFINRGTLEMDYTDEYWERRYTVRSDVQLVIWGFDSFDSSYAMDRVSLRHQRDIKRVYHYREHLVGDYLGALACLPSSRDGNTRSS